MTFPARQYSVNGERRSFALLRPANGGRQRAGRDSAVHPRRVHPRRGRLLNGPFVLSQAAGPSAPPPGGHGFSRRTSTDDLGGHSWTPPCIPIPSRAPPGRALRAVPSAQITDRRRGLPPVRSRPEGVAAGRRRRTGVQRLTVQVPATRLHLVSVDVDGVARLKLQPRFERVDDQRVVRHDGPPAYDAPPTLEDLFQRRRPNHELERALSSPSASQSRNRRRDADRDRRSQARPRRSSRPHAARDGASRAHADALLPGHRAVAA